MLRRGLSARLAQKLFAVLDPSHNDCVYTTVQIARNFSKPIYKSLPWFLEYPEGKFAPEDELRHNSAVKERTERVNKQTIVVHGSEGKRKGLEEPNMPATLVTTEKNVDSVTQSNQPSHHEGTTTAITYKKRSKL